MAVAELAAGGALPFVPSDGGQHAIVCGDDRLQYDSPADAIDTIDRALSAPDDGRELRPDPDEIERRFGRDRFRRAIREAVAAYPERPPVGPTETAAESPASVPAEDD